MNPEDRARELFARTWGTPPAVVRSAPGRINLIGEHVDYHGGHVLPVATSARTAIALGPGTGGLRATSEQSGAAQAAWPPRPLGSWIDYAAGVASIWSAECVRIEGGLDVAVASDVPSRSGLSSSAALEVATALALTAMTGRNDSPRALAELAWRAETEFVGVPCGRMDQLASALAAPTSALLIDCRSYEAQSVSVGVDLVLVDSGERRSLRETPYAERRREGAEALALLRAWYPSLDMLVDVPVARLAEISTRLPDPLGKRVRHVVNENQRAVLAARALDTGDVATFGTLVNASHDSLRDLYECSTPRLDEIVTSARALPDVLGARLVGAGWGGSVLVVVEKGKAPAVSGAFPSGMSYQL